MIMGKSSQEGMLGKWNQGCGTLQCYNCWQYEHMVHIYVRILQCHIITWRAISQWPQSNGFNVHAHTFAPSTVSYNNTADFIASNCHHIVTQFNLGSA